METIKFPKRGRKALVIGPQKTVGARMTVTDIETHRNSKMIKSLMRPDVNGVFLFCLVKNEEMIGSEFFLPPGLSKEASQMFEKEFMQLMEKYAKVANA